MLGLYLLASHLVGDFVLQTRWQAAGKFGWTWKAFNLRHRHCVTYTAAFVPAVVAAHPGVGRAFAFFFALEALHFLTDAQRFPSTLGDVVAWRTRSRSRRTLSRMREVELAGGTSYESWTQTLTWPPANPWPALPLALDQTLHVAQLALLGGLLLT